MMAGLNDDVDPEGLLEYSVVFTDRSLNHMSKSFQNVMKDLSSMLKEVYNADKVAIVPGGGSYAMEAVARQFGNEKKCLVVRNGWFSYRWSQIFEAGDFCEELFVVKARQETNENKSPFAPANVEDVVAKILENSPDVVFAPHVETSAGIILPEEYLSRVSEAVHKVNGIMVLDCIASGCAWVDMRKTGVDVLISAPQKGWSSTPSSGLVMMSERASEKMENSVSNSFSIDLKKWLEIMAAYENNGHAYHTTMPTDSLKNFRDTMIETKKFGFKKVEEEQWRLGNEVRDMLSRKGLISVAAKGYEAPGVVVSYTDDTDVHNGKKFRDKGIQIAAGVPLKCDEKEDFMTFRIGLFGLDKLYNVDAALERLNKVVQEVFN